LPAAFFRLLDSQRYPRSMESAEGTGGKRCACCAAVFVCGRGAPGGCWCARLPPLRASRLAADIDCLCPACLAALCAQQAAEAAAESPR